MCCEVMIANTAVRASIRESKIHQMDSLIQVGAKYGMQTMNHSLLEAYRAGVISKEDALSRSNNPTDLSNQMGRDQKERETGQRV